MVEGQVHHGIHACRPAAQAGEVFKVAAVGLNACLLQLLGTGVAAGEPAHLVACGDKFLDKFCTDKPSGSSNKDSHRDVSSCCLAWAAGPLPCGGMQRRRERPESGGNLRIRTYMCTYDMKEAETPSGCRKIL